MSGMLQVIEVVDRNVPNGRDMIIQLCSRLHWWEKGIA